MLRLVVFLNGARGLACVERLVGGAHQIALAVVPGRPESERLRTRLAELGVESEAVADVNAEAFRDRLRALAPDLAVVAGYGQIFRPETIAIPRLGTVNLHGGRVPDYRGGSPLNWQIINGEPAAGLSVLRMTAGIDDGPVLAAGEIPLQARTTIADLQAEANRRFPALLERALDELAAGTLQETPQPEAGTYWHQRAPQDGAIDFARMTALEVDALVRAVGRPYPGAFAFRGAVKVRFDSVDPGCPTIRGVPGRALWLQGKGPYVVCRDRAILVEAYQAEDGCRIATGDILAAVPVGGTRQAR